MKPRTGPTVGVVIGLILGVGLGAVAQWHTTGTRRVVASGSQVPGTSSYAAPSSAPPGATNGPSTTAGLPAASAATAPSAGSTPGVVAGNVGGSQPPGSPPPTVSNNQVAATGIAPTHGPVRGVTASSVTIGIATLDLSAVKYLGPEYDNGDVQGQWNALLADWHDRHLLPVNGRDVQFKFASYSVLNTDQQRQACVTLVDDDQSFAVVAPEFFYQTGSDCVAREKRTPLLTSEGPADDVFNRGAPYLFAVQMSTSRNLRNFVYWADSRHVLKGHRLGVYYLNDGVSGPVVQSTIDVEMKRLGYPPPVEYATSNEEGGPDDALAVQKFRSAGVDVAALFASPGGFTQQADAQRYHPTYIQTDFNGGTSDVGTNTYAPDQYDGTYAMTTERRGEAAAGIPPTADEKACVDNYNRRSGRHVAPPGPGGHETAEWVFVVLSCDEGKLLLHALEAAGHDLTPASYVAGLESVKNTPMIRFPNVTFGPGQYQGDTQQRTLQWHANCTCWRAIGAFQPLWVP